VAGVLKSFRRDLNAVMSRGVRRVYQIALREYRDTLDSHGLLDFSEVLAGALTLLSQMEEFARSRYRLEGRYHHVLLDEFQDTSRAQWTLVALLIRSWGEGFGIADGTPLKPSIFLVGDRKQSIYGFRDADVAVMEEAASFVDGLRGERDSRRAISRSFRAVPQILAFANDLFQDIQKDDSRLDAFRFDAQDRFPVERPIPLSDSLGIVTAPTVGDCADAVAAEIQRLLDSEALVRDAEDGGQRPVTPRDIGILFRTKDTHRDFEKALQRRNIPSYVYRGLGFFEADEIKDVLALLRYLAAPESNLRAAAFLRSRFVRMTDRALQKLAPRLAAALSGQSPCLDALEPEDRVVIERTRRSVARWLDLVDRLPPAEILDMILNETSYVVETRGPRVRQAHENLKKIRAMVRRVQNRGYATMSRVAEHLDRLTAGDESNAVIDAGDSVSLMTIHAAKGLEFPVVFLVNLTRGTGNRRSAIRVVSEPGNAQAWLSVGDFQSEADKDAKAKDREETKRLLYVALTRARDRIYLASEIKDARWRAFGGSLGDMLPISLRAVFEAASQSTAPGTAEWVAASGHTHVFRVCVKRETEAVFSPNPAALGEKEKFDPDAPDNFRELIDPFALPRIAVTESLSVAPGMKSDGPPSNTGSDTLVGTLVHRLFQHFGGTLAGERSQISEALARVLRDDEAVDAGDTDGLFGRAGSVYEALCAEPIVAEAFATGNALFEVPFSFRRRASQTILRGTFDCLVRRPDGGLTVLELKTGKRAPEHELQLATYVAAARALHPGTVVEGRLVYAGEPDLDDRALDSKH
jgi:ATP-dependent exoDNAse (exonuclease V) beta subunit